MTLQDSYGAILNLLLQQIDIILVNESKSPIIDIVRTFQMVIDFDKMKL